MTPHIPMELNFLAAMLHGRRSRLAEAARLDELCLIRTVPELSRILFPGEDLPTAVALQRRLVVDLLHELSRLAGGAAQDRRDLLSWLRIRFQVENLKVLARGRFNRIAVDSLLPHLVPLPRDLALDAPKLVAAESVDAFIARIPNPVLVRRLQAVDAACLTQPGTFHLEAALDHAYLGEMGFRARGVAGTDRTPILAALRQEIDIFHLMVVVRGKFSYGLKPETLVGLHVDGGALALERFSALLAAADLEAVAERAAGGMIDERPQTADPAELETLAWNRLHRLANKAFRQGHMGMGAVIGYTILRRLELANLITLCEGIRTGTAPGALRARMIPRTPSRTPHV